MSPGSCPPTAAAAAQGLNPETGTVNPVSPNIWPCRPCSLHHGSLLVALMPCGMCTASTPSSDPPLAGGEQIRGGWEAMRHEGCRWEIRHWQMDGDQTFQSTLFTTPSSAAAGDPGTGSGSVPPWAGKGQGWGHGARSLGVSQRGWMGSPLAVLRPYPKQHHGSSPLCPHPIPPWSTGLEPLAAVALTLSSL